MKQLIIYITLIVIFAACGKTDLDKEREQRIIGKWYTTGLSFAVGNDTLFFEFEDDNEGRSKVSSSVDEYTWEIVRKTLKTYYAEAPDYAIGYDKYNSKGVFSIEEFDDNEVKLEQHLSNGMHTVFTIYRIE